MIAAGMLFKGGAVPFIGGIGMVVVVSSRITSSSSSTAITVAEVFRVLLLLLLVLLLLLSPLPLVLTELFGWDALLSMALVIVISVMFPCWVVK